MKIAIVGKSRCGKDAAAEYIASKTDLRFVWGTSRSMQAEVFLMMLAAEARKHSPDGDACATPAQCYDNRHKHRSLWAMVGDCICYFDKLALVRRCLRSNDIVVGMRRLAEVNGSRKEKLFDHVIYISRPFGDDSTCEILPTDATMVIHNIGTLEDLHAKLDKFIAEEGIA